MHDEIRRFTHELRPGLDDAAHGVTVVLQVVAQRHRQVLLALDDENATRAVVGTTHAAGSVNSMQVPSGPLSEDAYHPAVHLHDTPADGQPESGPTTAGLRPAFEVGKHTVPVSARDANAVVAYPNRHVYCSSAR